MKDVRSCETTVQLGDYTVFVQDFMINRNADDIQKTNPKVWEEIPRGCAKIVISKAGKVLYGDRLVGLRKFNYDSSVSDEKLHNENYSIIYTEKEDGECFHIKAWIEPMTKEIFWMGGSKHVHGVVRQSNYIEDLNQWTKERYTFMFKEFMTRFYKLGYATFEVASFLNSTNYTFCGETLNPERQHLVKYPSEDILFYAISKDAPSSEGLTAMPPIAAMMKFAELGLKHVQYCVISCSDNNPENFIDIRKKIEDTIFQKKNSEGAVIYVVDNETGKTVDIYKFKTQDYIIRRAIRERICSMTSSSISDRLRTLYIDVPNRADIEAFYIPFSQWLAYRVPFSATRNQYISENWVDLEYEFAQLSEDERKNVSEMTAPSPEIQKQVFICVAPFPGCGKSTLCETLCKLLPNSVRLSQDQCGGKKSKFLSELRKLIKNMNVKNIFIDKNNSARKMRHDYDQIISDCAAIPIQYYWLNFVPKADESLENCQTIASERIRARGLNHEMLFPNKKLRGVLMNFQKMYEPLTSEECDRFPAVNVGIEQSIVENIYKFFDYFNQPYPANTMDMISDTKVKLSEMKEENLKNGWWGVFLPTDQYQKLADKIAAIIEKEKLNYNIKKEFHITTCWKNEELAKFWAEIDYNMEIKFRPIKLVWNAFIMTLVVEPINVEHHHFQNKFPHITIAHLPNIKPVYSNEILEKQDKDVYSNNLFDEEIFGFVEYRNH